MRTIILSPINRVKRRSYLDVASQRSCIAYPHRWSSIGVYSNHFTPFYLQRDVSRKATARAVLQAYALPNRSFRRNIEAAQRQYESMWRFLFLFVPIPSSNFQISKF